jgi:ABC-2 type transport system ATP-binding protein
LAVAQSHRSGKEHHEIPHQSSGHAIQPATRLGRPGVTAAIAARGLGKRYGRRWALADCTVAVPAGRVTGLVGPNGAGKTTLLNLATGMLRPTSGSIQVLGRTPASGPDLLRKVGYVAQDTPLIAALSVGDHLRLGARMNAGWDAGLASSRIGQLHLDRSQKAGKLSGGQRAQLALTMAIAKQPELLILDEPVASLDPLARNEFLRTLAETTAERSMSVVLSSHLVSDLERACDYLIVLVDSRVQVADTVENLLATHYLLTSADPGAAAWPATPGVAQPDGEVISVSRSLGQTTMLVRAVAPLIDPALTVSRASLEDLVLGYMSRARAAGPERAAQEATR